MPDASVWREDHTPVLVVFTGLPGTGKSTLAARAAGLLRCPVFAKDVLEAALWRAEIGPAQGVKTGWAGYELLAALAESQLMLGQPAVLDSVATFERIRTRWRDLAAAHGAMFVSVNTICSDQTLHRARIESRKRGIPGWPELTWEHIDEVRSRYEPPVADLTLDATDTLAANVTAMERLLMGGRMTVPR